MSFLGYYFDCETYLYNKKMKDKTLYLPLSTTATFRLCPHGWLLKRGFTVYRILKWTRRKMALRKFTRKALTESKVFKTPLF